MNLLEVENISKHYRQGRTLIEAVRSVSLTVCEGEVLAFLGPNGAGKTTTIKTIAGLIEPHTGQVRIAGIDPHRHPQALRKIGAVLEGNRNLYWRLTPVENLAYFGVLKGLTRKQAKRRAETLIERFELTSKRKTPVQNLSRGMQQKLAIATAIIHDPQLLLLDEPTLGLDVEATQTVKTLIREIAQEGRGILLTTHQLDIAEELSDRVAIIQNGEIVAQAPTQELIRQFSGTHYIIEIEGELNFEQRETLTAVGATIEGDRAVSIRGTEALYQVLGILKPLPLVRVKRDQSSLTEIFLKFVRNEV
jgi:ABC-2 type transport system ATP-binding protein